MMACRGTAPKNTLRFLQSVQKAAFVEVSRTSEIILTPELQAWVILEAYEVRILSSFC